MTEKIILGIDEAGRGPWAGPLVVGAVILGPDFKTLPEYERLTDSKKLTTKKRETLNDLILAHAAATGLGWVAAEEIDRYGLGPSLKLAARRAVKPILAQISANLKASEPANPKTNNLKTTNPEANKTTNPKSATPTEPTPASSLQKFDEIIIDGTINLLADTPLADRVTLLPKADFLVKEVSAASIIAKVARDRYMTDLAAKYPGYGFDKHVGYGTAAHKSALLDLGTCPEHRKSFRPIAELLAKTKQTSDNSANQQNVQNPQNPPSTTATGQKAEQIIAEYLQTELNHTIIAQNFKTKSYEIDLISINSTPNADNPTSVDPAPTIYFTEVKYRKSASRGAALAQITPKKRQQIQFAAETFLAKHPEYKQYRPLLAVASVEGPDFRLKTWFTLSE